ncbi:MAG: TIGR03557 family F420-dependent LLM class oxidoreductase [Methanospirillum sp.]
MVEIGYTLSTEEHDAPTLVRNAPAAEKAGFDFLTVSDHYHPWIGAEGQSPFAWTVLGGVAAVTDRVTVAIAVTCPTIRYHPALVAQWAATAASLMEGRFELGIGSGENLNEHIYGDRWPPATVRIAMMKEAIDVIRTLWKGEVTDYYGTYFVVEKAKVFSLPRTLPPIVVSATGPIAGKVAGEVGDQLVLPMGDPEKVRTVMDAFKAAGGSGKPCMTQVSFCYHEDETKAKEIAYRYWPISANKGQLNRELPSWKHYEQLATMTTPEQVAEKVVCGSDLERFVAKVRSARELGFDRIAIHQVGPEQENFLGFAKDELLPAFR